jgi:hypothetical protein
MPKSPLLTLEWPLVANGPNHRNSGVHQQDIDVNSAVLENRARHFGQSTMRGQKVVTICSVAIPRVAAKVPCNNYESAEVEEPEQRNPATDIAPGGHWRGWVHAASTERIVPIGRTS